VYGNHSAAGRCNFPEDQEAGLAEDYIREFVQRQQERMERERAHREESLQAARTVLKEKVQVESQAPAVWEQLLGHIRQRVGEINAANGADVLTLQSPGMHEMILRCGTRFLILLYSREKHLINIEGSFAIPRKWRILQAIPDGEQVSFAEQTTREFVPLSFDEIMKGLLSSFDA
jgi:hypothetical protein